MANPTKPKPPPVLEDPYQVKEAFATEVVVAVVGKGTARLTFAVTRLESARPNEPPQPKRVVVSRLILDEDGIKQLWDYLQRINLFSAQTSQGVRPSGEQQH